MIAAETLNRHLARLQPRGIQVLENQEWRTLLIPARGQRWLSIVHLLSFPCTLQLTLVDKQGQERVSVCNVAAPRHRDRGLSQEHFGQDSDETEDTEETDTWEPVIQAAASGIRVGLAKGLPRLLEVLDPATVNRILDLLEKLSAVVKSEDDDTEPYIDV